MLQIPGAPALSAFRIAKLLSRLQALDSRITALDSRFDHFVDLERVEFAGQTHGGRCGSNGFQEISAVKRLHFEDCSRGKISTLITIHGWFVQAERRRLASRCARS